ncbi:MAG: beta-galactosidase, partial [Candidatus Ornithomonoglobus sp.]
MKKILTVRNGGLYINDQPFYMRSGAIHYFRIHPEQWEDRLYKLKLCGLNTVETYIAWNVQEPQRGKFNFEGFGDFERFITIAENLGLNVIIRPGPFICAEWEMGGLPSWLLNIDGMELRRYNRQFLECTEEYFKAIFEKIIPHLSTNGGGVIAIQAENEFGGFKRPDSEYLLWIKNMYASLGVDVPIFTSDGVGKNELESGSIDGVLMTANFGSNAEGAFNRLEVLRPGEPKICMEFWDGWFDQWGRAHHTRDPHTVIQELEYIVNNGGHFNIYMFSGGTNFGFMNGSNCNPDFEPCITSYDYGAPISENGEPTELYYMIKELLTGTRTCDELDHIMGAYRKKAYGEISFKAASVFDRLNELGSKFVCDVPLNMEKLSQNYGFIVYEADVSGMSGIIDIGEPRDYAMFYGDGRLLGVYERGAEYEPIKISGIKKLRILVENLGRVNYGQRIFDKKGIIGDVRIGEQIVSGFSIYTLNMGNIPKLEYESVKCEPMLYVSEFFVDDPADTFIFPKGFTHGIIFINGFNLGRYRSIGPQMTLYVPAQILKHGINQVVVMDLYASDTPVAEF